MAYSITLFQKPFSYNSFSIAKKMQYALEFRKELNKKYRAVNMYSCDLYGIVYYIRPQVNNTDADNISKPIWDSMCNILYYDDKLIRHRRASIIEASQFSDINIERIGSKDLRKIIRAIEIKKDVIYVEIGKYTSNFIEFGIEV